MNNVEQLSFLGAPAVATDYIWRLSDGYPKSNGLKVFSCFDKCKEKILKIALELDIDGMTPATFNNFHEYFDEIARAKILECKKNYMRLKLKFCD